MFILTQICTLLFMGKLEDIKQNFENPYFTIMIYRLLYLLFTIVVTLLLYSKRTSRYRFHVLSERLVYARRRLHRISTVRTSRSFRYSQ